MLTSTHRKIGVGWAICTVLGISLFYFSKSSITNKRYENMKIRERMQLANTTEYEPSYRKFTK